ncbi:oxysterol-binding protein-related protein 11-like isoform X2 [Amphiura filiformis]|uniref:oxysterol-binding protein-related protein 11-like isoform X2 n=1 Tax=Amphiura filiformis TaxID=82378 RepID=UPI003B215798
MAANEGSLREGVSNEDSPSVTEAEKQQIATVVRRAREVEEEDIFSQPMEGQLYKYTNVVKGFQYRWFMLDPQRGTLDYYMTEDNRKQQQKPRGSVHLTGAVVSPSDEDSQTFTVNAANGEVYRLRAQDARERQHWVSRLRAVVQRQGEVLSQGIPEPVTPTHGSTESLDLRTSVRRYSGLRHSPSNSLSVVTPQRQRSASAAASLTATQESLRNAKDVIAVADTQKRALVSDIEGLPQCGHPLNALDHDCLLLKATSQSAMDCLEQCLGMLQRQDNAQGHRSQPNVDLSQSMANITSANNHSDIASGQEVNGESSTSAASYLVPYINPADEVADTKQETDRDLGGVEEHKSVILHLLSQLKLGMDLTRVVLPTFILEKRSLLEMYADFMAHPDMFVRIAGLSTPDARMIAVVEYYLCSFHVGRKGSLAKKPFNPIIGETFHCSWDVPQPTKSTQEEVQTEVDKTETVGSTTDGNDRVTFTAEQVSHHPPVSAFYAECASKNICMNSWIWTKSKFLGMSVGVNMVGEGVISLLDHGEEYTATFPSAYGRSILTVPWMELGGRCNIQCPQSGYQAAITFHTKPFYGGKVHRVSAEVKNPSNAVICRISGEWNGTLEFSYSSGDKKVIDTTKLPSIPKKVRPISLQGTFESRRLWQHVTNSLKVGDINTATEHKRYLEERQRQEERQRKESSTSWETKLFQRKGEGWGYNRILQKPSS